MPANTSGTTNKNRECTLPKKCKIEQKFQDEAHQLFEPVTKTTESAFTKFLQKLFPLQKHRREPYQNSWNHKNSAQVIGGIQK